MDLRAVIALAALLCAVTATTSAGAWQEAHQAGDDVRVRVEPGGMAYVQHTVRWRVVRGPVKWVDLVSVDPGAALDPDASITSEDGHQLAAHLVRADDKTVRILVDQPRSLMRGTFTFQAGWHVDLVATHALSYDGATWRLAWSGPVASEGIDAARTVFDLPGAPDAPRPILSDTGAVDDSAVATLEREGGRDVLELVRPHVARGESASWTVRIDPRALPDVSDPMLRPVRVEPQAEMDRVHEVSAALMLGALALGFGVLVARKDLAFSTECASRGATSRSLLPVPRAPRATLAGLALAGGVALESTDRPLAGAALVALAALAAALRAPGAKQAVRGPGRWLALRPEEAFRSTLGVRHWSDVDARMGRATLCGCALVTALLAVVARRYSPEGPLLVSLDAMAFLPLFLTGRGAQLPPDRERSSAPWLARAFGLLRALGPLRAVPWARVTIDGSKIDELRLLVLPRAAIPGVAGIELGLAWTSTLVGWTGSPEVLVRVLDGSAAAARLALSGPFGVTLPGRRPDERVLRVAPRSPTPIGTVSLARAFAEALTDRRSELAPVAWASQERRVARPARPRAAA